jgi:hypothetical protein
MSAPAQHAGLSPERWGSFSLGRQVLMIANEMNRASKLMAPEDAAHLGNAYERVLNLTDLAIVVATRPAVRREMLRWRDLVAALYIAPQADARSHAAAFRALLLLTPEAAGQIPYVLS